MSVLDKIADAVTNGIANINLATFASGGKSVALAETVLNGMLVLVGAALFVACAVLVVQRVTGSNRDLTDNSYSMRRVVGMAFIVFTIVLIARAGVGVANEFLSLDEGPNAVAGGDYVRSATALPYVVSPDGTERSYLDLIDEG